MIHTWHRLWTKICEMRQNFKWDLIKFCETFTKIAFKLPKGILKPLSSFNKPLIDTKSVIYVYFFITSLINLSGNYVRFENSSGNWLSEGLKSVRFYLTVWDMACMVIIQWSFFLFLIENVCCGPSLEPTCRDSSNEGHNICLYGIIRKIFHKLSLSPLLIWSPGY